MLQAQQQHGSIRFQEGMNSKRFSPENEFDCPRWEIASFDPNDLGRRSKMFDLALANEIPIRADQCGKIRSPRRLEDQGIG
jgi:hypothetical protein